MPKTPTVAVYPGSFDPPTQGHLNIIERGLKIFDRVIVAVAVNSAKKTVLTTQERVALLKEIFKERKGVEIDSFEDRLLVDYARSKKAQVILRGLRTTQDYEYEFQMALANKKLAPDVETVFMMTDPEYSHVSSSLLREIISLGGSSMGMVPEAAQKILKAKLKEKFKK